MANVPASVAAANATASYPLVPNDLDARGRTQLRQIMQGGITEDEVRMAKDQFSQIRDLHQVGPERAASPSVARELHQADALGRAVQNNYVFQQIRKALTSGDNQALRNAVENGMAAGGLNEALAHMSSRGIHEMALRLDPNGDGLGSRSRLAEHLHYAPGIPLDRDTRTLLDASLSHDARMRMIRQTQ